MAERSGARQGGVGNANDSGNVSDAAGNGVSSANSGSQNGKKNAAVTKTVWTTKVGDLRKLDIDDLPEIIKIRDFISSQINNMSRRLNDPTGLAMLRKEEVLDFFADVYTRYMQGADIAPELNHAFIEESNRLDAFYDSFFVEAKRHKSIFDNSRNNYFEAVRRMKSAYESLNETALIYEMDAAITGYEPEINAMPIAGACREYWGGDANA